MSAVADFINQSTSYANDMLNGAKDALQTAKQSVGNINYEEINVGDIEPPGGAPALPTIDFTLPFGYGPVDTTLEAAPTFSGNLIAIGDVDIGIAPELSAVAPGLSMPSRPADMPAFTEVAPVITTDIAFPEPPSELEHPTMVAPVTPDRVAPTKPDVLLPSFDALAPVNTAVAPTGLQDEMLHQYRQAVPEMVAVLDLQVDAMLGRFNPRFHDQMDGIETRLNQLMAGGSGLTPAVENAIYERARDKNHAEYERLRDSAWNDVASKGFTLPNSALVGTLFSARQALADSNARAANDIAIKQAEMEQQNLQFAITASSGLRTAMLNAAMGYHQTLVTINGQALEYAKTSLSLVIEVYNTQVKEFSVRLEAYRADAAIYEARLKGALAAIDLYRAEIDALQAMTQVDVAKIGVYKAQVESLGVLANVYRSRIEAVQSKAGLEKLKLELFQSQVQTYSAQVQAKNAEWQGYQAAVSGEEAKVRIFGQQVQAYSAQMAGYKAKVEAQAEGVRARSLANNAILDRFNAELKAYSTKVEARANIAKIVGTDAQMRLSFYQENIASKVKYNTMALDLYKAQADTYYRQAEVKLKAAMASGDAALNYQKVVADLASATANAYTGIAKATLSGMNTIVGMTEESAAIGT